MNKKLLIGFITSFSLIIVILLVIFFFVWPKATTPPSQKAPQNAKITKESSWQVGQVAVVGNYADADVIALGDGRYRLYYSLEPEVSGFKGQVYSAISSDGKKWIEEWNGTVKKGNKIYKFKDVFEEFIFSPKKLETFLKITGFKILKIYGSRTGGNFNNEISYRRVYLCKKH